MFSEVSNVKVVSMEEVSISAFSKFCTCHIKHCETPPTCLLQGSTGRAWLGMATVDSRVLAYGGMTPLYRDSLSDVQELDRETETWRTTEDSLSTAAGISSFGTATVYMDQVCV